MTSARAIEARICMPPESSRGRCRANSARPTSASAASDRAVAAVRGRRRARSSGRRTFASTRAHGISVGDWKTKPTRRPGPPVAAEPPPHQRIAPCVGVERPANEIEQRRLAAARGSEQRDEFAATDGEIDRGERLRAVRDRACRRRAARRPAASSRRTPGSRDVWQGRTFTRDDRQRVRRRVVDVRLREARRAQEVDGLLPARVGHREQAAASPCRSPVTIAYSCIFAWP